jgi:DNA modification methylase
MNQEGLADFMIDFELQLEDLELMDFADIDLNDFKMEADDIDNEGLCDPDAVPVDVPTKAKLGELFILGNHRLLCGDSTDLSTVERLMSGDKADMVFTSPPYNGDTHLDYGDGQNKKLYENDFDSKTPAEYIDFCHQILSICFEITSGFIFWNVNYNGKSRYEYIESIHPFIRKLHETIIWKKTGMPLASGLTRNFEFIFCFRNGERKHLGKTNETNFNFWEVSNINSQDRNNHRACFPVALPQKGIELGSENGQIIFEPFGGSGSTLIACEKTNRKCFMMELDTHYIDVIIARWQKFSGKKAVREDGVLWDDIQD